MVQPPGEADPAIAAITSRAFPTPALAIRTNDPSEIRLIRGFAEHQAVAARTLGAAFLRHVAAAHTRRDTTRAIITTLNSATTWRHQLAIASQERRRGQGIALTAERFRTPITDTDSNFVRLGYVGRARIDSTWDPATRTYTGGTATPAFHSLARFGQLALDRFATEAARLDVLQNKVALPDCSVVLGNRLLRGNAAAAAAEELVDRIAARGADASAVETGGDPIYTATAASRDRARLQQAAITAFADALDAPTAGDRDTVLRRWALAAYCLYQAPQFKKGSDSVARVVLVTLGTIALRDVPVLPSDIDLQAYVLGQQRFVDALLAHQGAGIRAGSRA